MSPDARACRGTVVEAFRCPVGYNFLLVSPRRSPATSPSAAAQDRQVDRVGGKSLSSCVCNFRNPLSAPTTILSYLNNFVKRFFKFLTHLKK